MDFPSAEKNRVQDGNGLTQEEIETGLQVEDQPWPRFGLTLGMDPDPKCEVNAGNSCVNGCTNLVLFMRNFTNKYGINDIYIYTILGRGKNGNTIYFTGFWHGLTHIFVVVFRCFGHCLCVCFFFVCVVCVCVCYLKNTFNQVYRLYKTLLSCAFHMTLPSFMGITIVFLTCNHVLDISGETTLHGNHHQKVTEPTCFLNCIIHDYSILQYITKF